MATEIRFNSKSDGYRQRLSTFFPMPVIHDNRVWPSAEHAYQAAKTGSEEMKSIIHDAPSAAYVKRLGRTLLLGMSLDEWNSIRVDVMRQIIRDKLKGDHALLAWLLHPSNAKATIIHEAPWDAFWGDGGGGGKNMLGKIYMELRDELREDEE